MASRTSAESVLSDHRPHRTRLRRLIAVVASSLALVASTLAGTISPASATPVWSALGTGVVGGSAPAMVQDSAGNIYVGGSFTTADGAPANYLAKWSPSTSTWSAIGGVPGAVSRLAIDSTGNIYASGTVTTTSEWIAKWDGSSWTTIGYADAYISALITDSAGTLYVGGAFSTIGGLQYSGFAVWNGTSWSTSANVLAGAVFAFAFDPSGTLYLGGYFSWDGRENIARYNTSTRMLSAMGSGMNGQVTALQSDVNGNIYAGGQFTTAGGVAASNVAKWSPTANAGTGAWSSLGSGMDSVVRTIVTTPAGEVYCGGNFVIAGGVTVNHIAKWDGTSWSALGSGTDDAVSSMRYSSTGILYVSGRFFTAGGLTVNRVAAWVPPPLAVSTSSLPAATVGTAYSQTLAATGGVSPYTWSVAAGSLPAGLSLNASTGVISGTPTTAGSSSFTVQVADSQSTPATATASLSITTGLAPLSVTTSTLANATVGASYSQTLVATGGMSPYTWSVTSGSLPTGLTLDPSTGDITGTPTTTGSSSFTVQVTDSQSTPATATASLSIVVAGASSNSNGGGNSNSSNGGNNSSSSSNSSAGNGVVESAEEEVRRPSPVLFSVLALGDACPSGWSGPSWEPWPNGGLGGRVCNKRIEWSIAQGAYEVDPVDALLSARVWQDRILRVIHRMV